MALPTKTNLETMDYSYGGVPFVSVATKAGIDLDTLDYSYAGVPFWGLEVSGGGPQSYTLTCAAGSYTLTGSSVTLTHTPASQNLTLACNAGSYSLTGTNADLTVTRHYTLTCEAGSYSLTGTNADPTLGYTANASQPAYLQGRDQSNGQNSAYLSGKVSLDKSQSAYLEGASVECSDVNRAYLKGSGDQYSTISVWITGNQRSIGSNYAYIKGSANTLEKNSAYIKGYGQIITPDGDIGSSSAGSWLDQDNGTALYAALKETLPDDATYVYLSGEVAVNDYFEVSLEDPDPDEPGAGNIVVYWRGRDQNNAGTLQIKVELRQGSTVIASDTQTMTAVATTYSFTLTAEQRNLISDWSDLRLRFTIMAI